jgi:hypothetical protein
MNRLETTVATIRTAKKLAMVGWKVARTGTWKNLTTAGN